VKPGDSVTVKERSKTMGRIVENASYAEGRTVPEWLSVSLRDLTVDVLDLPERNQIDAPVQEQLIVEYYSK
jgi:small subunit ribosomal protein S4